MYLLAIQRYILLVILSIKNYINLHKILKNQKSVDKSLKMVYSNNETYPLTIRKHKKEKILMDKNKR